MKTVAVLLLLLIWIGYFKALSMLFNMEWNEMLHIQLYQDWILVYLVIAFVSALWSYYKYPLHTYVRYVSVSNYTQKIVGLILATHSAKHNLSLALLQCLTIICVSWILLSSIRILKLTFLLHTTAVLL